MEYSSFDDFEKEWGFDSLNLLIGFSFDTDSWQWTLEIIQPRKERTLEVFIKGSDIPQYVYTKELELLSRYKKETLNAIASSLRSAEKWVKRDMGKWLERTKPLRVPTTPAEEE